MLDQANLYREKLLDDLSIFSDEMTELLLSGEEISPSMIRSVLRDAPFLICAFLFSAVLSQGQRPARYGRRLLLLPAPNDLPAIEGPSLVNRKKARTGLTLPSAVYLQNRNAPSWRYVLHSRLLRNPQKLIRAFNPRANEKENIPQIWRIKQIIDRLWTPFSRRYLRYHRLRFSVTGTLYAASKTNPA